MSWYSVNRACAATWFLVVHPSRPEKSSCWKSAPFLCSTYTLVLRIPCISSSFSNIPDTTPTWGIAFCSNTKLYIQHYSDNTKAVSCAVAFSLLVSSSRCDEYNGQVMNAWKGWSAWCLNSAIPPRRHQHSFSLSTDWTASQGKGQLHNVKVICIGAESVHQNCVIRRCAHLHMASSLFFIFCCWNL